MALYETKAPLKNNDKSKDSDTRILDALCFNFTSKSATKYNNKAPKSLQVKAGELVARSNSSLIVGYFDWVVLERGERKSLKGNREHVVGLNKSQPAQTTTAASSTSTYLQSY